MDLDQLTADDWVKFDAEVATTVDRDAKARDVNVRAEARAKAHAKHIPWAKPGPK